MTMRKIGAGPRLSKGVIANGTLYLSGLVPRPATRGKSVKEQTADVLHQIDELLAEAGTDRSMLSAMIWLQDIRTVDDFNAIWEGWIASDSAPTRACVEARLQSPAIMVEVAATALVEQA